MQHSGFIVRDDYRRIDERRNDFARAIFRLPFLEVNALQVLPDKRWVAKILPGCLLYMALHDSSHATLRRMSFDDESEKGLNDESRSALRSFSAAENNCDL